MKTFFYHKFKVVATLCTMLVGKLNNFLVTIYILIFFLLSIFEGVELNYYTAAFSS